MVKSIAIIFAAVVAAGTPALAQNSATPSGQKAEAKGAVAVDQMPKSAACIISKAIVCKSDGKCAPSETIGQLSLPMKVTVDFQNRVLITVGNDGFPVSSAISTFGAGAGSRQLVMQGIDQGIGWVMHGSGESKTVSFSMADHDTVLSAFGSCEIDRGE